MGVENHHVNKSRWGKPPLDGRNVENHLSCEGVENHLEVKCGKPPWSEVWKTTFHVEMWKITHALFPPNNTHTLVHILVNVVFRHVTLPQPTTVQIRPQNLSQGWSLRKVHIHDPYSIELDPDPTHTHDQS